MSQQTASKLRAARTEIRGLRNLIEILEREKAELLAGCKAALGAFEHNHAINWDDLARVIEKAEGRAESSASGESEDARDAARYRFIRDCDRFNSRGVMDGGRAGMMVGFWREDLDREVDRRIAATHEVHRVLPSEKTP